VPNMTRHRLTLTVCFAGGRRAALQSRENPSPATRTSRMRQNRIWRVTSQTPPISLSRGVAMCFVMQQRRQQRADIDAHYELVERVDQKVDAVDVKLVVCPGFS